MIGRLDWRAFLGTILFISGCGGSTGGEGACDFPICVTDLEKDCIGVAACTKQQTTTASGEVDDVCFANGSKAQLATSMDTATKKATMSFTAKNENGVVCMSSETSFDSIALTSTITYRNGSGSVVATAVVDSSAGATISCVGGPTKNLGASCLLPDAGTSGSSTCTTGICAF